MCYSSFVENTGFEPVTFWLPVKRASQLRQSPVFILKWYKSKYLIDIYKYFVVFIELN